VRYLMSEDAQTTFAKVGQFSVLKSLGDKMTSIQPYYQTYVEQMASARPRPATPAWTEIDAKMKSALQEAFLGNGDIKGALDKLAPELDALLAKYN
jgi:multiple sugar transport system substrate-binding protein